MSENSKKSPAPIVRARTPKPEPLTQLFPRGERRALSHVGGEVQIRGGSPEEGEALIYALNVSAEEDEVMADVHGFHSYPARLHPLTARRLVERLSKPGGTVMDPFCGSGTVVVEARALGRVAIGSDLNPLAVEISWLKSRGVTRKFTADLIRTAERIAQMAEDRRTEKAPPITRYEAEERERYPVHILLELDSLTHGVNQIEHNEPMRVLRLVISSLLTKLSFSEGDTTRQKAPRRLPPGFAIRMFLEKTRELTERLNDYNSRLPDKAPRAYVTHADARQLKHIEDGSVDLIITSPPYPGVYDYLDHHLHRLRWLGLREGALRTHEIGARRTYKFLNRQDAIELWRREMGDCLREMKRVLASDGRGIVVVADSVIDRTAIRADAELEAAARYAGVDLMAIASQERPLFLHGAERAFGDSPRQEHVVIFRPGRKVAGGPRRKRNDDDDQDRPRAPRAPRAEGETRGPRRPDDQGPPGRTESGGRETWRPFSEGQRPARPEGEARGPRRPFNDGPRPPRPEGEARGPRRPFNDGPRPPRPEGEARGPRRVVGDGPRPPRQGAPGGERGGYGPRQDAPRSQDKSWGERPRGPARPSDRSRRKPK